MEREVAERAAALGRLAVRSSASIEDGALGAGAGVFASLTDVAPGDVWPAIRAVWTSALTPLAVAYARRRAAASEIGVTEISVTEISVPEISVIVQRFVPGARVTAYTRPIGAPRGDQLWLSRGDQLERLPRAAAGRPEAALALAAEAAIDAADGADVELVVEAAPPARIWIVQARPMIHPVRRARAAPPPILLAPLREDGRRWTWDIAHNPDPLSPAQAGLVDRIDRAPWSPHALRVCGGYLYTAPRAAVAPPVPPADRAELASRIAAIEARLAPQLAGAATAADAVERYVAFLHIWTCELSPLVAAARRTLLDRLAEVGHPLERIPALAASLIGPRRVARDPVMSPAWDVAVPTFAETRTAQPPERPLAPLPTPPDDLAAEILLARAAADAAERDDVWFARAQWLVRSALLARSRELDLRDDDIFWIPLDEAVTLRTLDPDDVHRRASAARAAHARAAEWDMPLIVQGGDACGESPRRRHASRSWRRTAPGRARRAVRLARRGALGRQRRRRGDSRRDAGARDAGRRLRCTRQRNRRVTRSRRGARARARRTCVVGCTGAWTQLVDGALVSVDGDAGLVTAVADAS